ncbi:hypothetical protein L7F22_012160 [Adiantum nelumboides]|nr:hypothetical protein [Adiantum nelumboides]
MLVLVDDFSRYTWVSFLKLKSEAFGSIRGWKAMVEKEKDLKVKSIRSDRGGEFLSENFARWCKSEGIRRQLTTPYTPSQNGVVERKNRTIMEMARAMLAHASLPRSYWAEACNTAVYIQNRSPTHALQDMTPFQAYYGRKPTVSHFRVFGCSAFVHIPKEKRQKLDFKSRKLLFLGYSAESDAYRLYDPDTRTTTVSRDVVFDESFITSAEGAAAQPIPILPPPSLPDPPASPVITPSTSHPVPPIQPPDVSPDHALSDSDSDLDVADATPEVDLAPPRREKRIPGWLYSTVVKTPSRASGSKDFVAFGHDIVNDDKEKAHVAEQPPVSFGSRQPSTHGLVNGQDSNEPSLALHFFMRDNAYGAMQTGTSNFMYGNIGNGWFFTAICTKSEYDRESLVKMDLKPAVKNPKANNFQPRTMSLQDICYHLSRRSFLLERQGLKWHFIGKIVEEGRALRDAKECFICEQGHFANECPQRNSQDKDDKSDLKGKKPKHSVGLVPDLVGDSRMWMPQNCAELGEKLGIKKCWFSLIQGLVQNSFYQSWHQSWNPCKGDGYDRQGRFGLSWSFGACHLYFGKALFAHSELFDGEEFHIKYDPAQEEDIDIMGDVPKAASPVVMVQNDAGSPGNRPSSSGSSTSDTGSSSDSDSESSSSDSDVGA